MWRKNFKHSAVVGIIRINTLRSGKDQLKSVFGVIDSNDTAWEESLKGIVDVNKLSPAYLHQPDLNSGKLDNASVSHLDQLFMDIAEFCGNEQTFQLLILLTLLDADGLPNASSYSRILKARDTYLKVYQRKLYAMNFSFIDYAKFRATLNNIKLVTNMIEIYITKESLS